MFFHLHGVEVVKTELWYKLDSDGELAAEVGLLGFKVDCLLDLLSWEDVIANRNVIHKDTF